MSEMLFYSFPFTTGHIWGKRGPWKFEISKVSDFFSPPLQKGKLRVDPTSPLFPYIKQMPRG